MSTNVNFSPNPSVTKTCTTAATTYTPRTATDCMFAAGTTVYWRVRPIDGPYPVSTGLPGLYSTPQVVVTTAPATDAGAWDNSALVTGLRIGLDGQAATGGGGCTPADLDDICDNVPSTPTLSWDPVPGAHAYVVYYAQDENFTTTEIPSAPVTYNTVFQLRSTTPRPNCPTARPARLITRTSSRA